MPTPEQYDVVVLGSGEAGKYIAWTQAKKGKRAVVIERRYIGGSCPNIACLPSKTHPTMLEGLIPLFSAVPSKK
jgi:pyruvate/2-oxoglutarate dehydrogenase complex dihydrolipoamide dehydrogenase (E3) component